MKVLILSASTGNGHMNAAFAIESELRRRGHDAKAVDVLDHTGPGFKEWYKGGYERLVRRTPWLWAHLYRTSDRKLFNFWVQSILDTYFVERMRKFFLKERPDWALCTHSLPQPALAGWKELAEFKTGVVVTDLYPQLMWLRGDPDWFFVPDDWSKNVLVKRIPDTKTRVTVTGIPVDSRFSQHEEKAIARAGLGLDPNKPLFLVTSGGIGGGPIGKVVRRLGSSGLDAQFIVVCGRSRHALAAARRALVKSVCPPCIQVKGHVELGLMARYMHAADAIVAKPGGITTFETLSAGLPFVVFEPFLIPGQEEKNAEFLVDSGIGVRVEGPAELPGVLRALMDDPGRLALMSQRALEHSKPRAAEMIADVLEAQAPGSARQTSAE